MRIAIYGLAADPIHNGHQEIIKELSKEFDEVHIIPSYNHLLKDIGVSFEHRFNMIKILYNDLEDNIYVSNDEEYNEDGSMYSLVNMISNNYEDDDEFFIVIGEDNAININKWKYNKELREEYKFVVFGRGEHERNNVWYNKDGNLFKPLSLNISSSDFRKLLDESVIDEKVYSYIIENNLYGID